MNLAAVCRVWVLRPRTLLVKEQLLIQQGEQEHLNDAQRAYDLTYGLITSTINQMGSREFGPATTPGNATQLAEQELTRLLPTALGSHPRNWFTMLDTLLAMTNSRDLQGWHNLSSGRSITEGNNTIYPLQQDPSFNVGQVPSDQVVNY